jgi:putative transposase
MHKVFRRRLKPTKARISTLNGHLDLCRWVYNETLALRKNACEKEDRSISYFESQKMLPIWEDSKTELKDVYSQALQDAVQKVDLALKAFFRRVRNDEDPGNPKFKGKGWYDSITYPQSGSRWKATSCISLRPKISKYSSIGL